MRKLSNSPFLVDSPLSVFPQSDALRDHVFPLFDLGMEEFKFLGTGFFIGQQSFALTAGHVVKNSVAAAALLASEEGWMVFEVTSVECHPEEDLAVLQMQPPGLGVNWSTFSTLKKRDTRSSLSYHLWGYPEDAAIELIAQGKGLRPDLVYSEGHVRRRISDVPLPGIFGSQFIELSAVAGAGCSGSPVFIRSSGDNWDLCGVYIGERVNDRATSVGYAVVLDKLAEWEPELLGRALAREINDIDNRW